MKLTAGGPVQGESLSKSKLVSVVGKDDKSGKEGKTAHATRTVVLEKGTPKTLTPYVNNEKKPTLHVFTGNAAVGDAQKAVGGDLAKPTTTHVKTPHKQPGSRVTKPNALTKKKPPSAKQTTRRRFGVESNTNSPKSQMPPVLKGSNVVSKSTLTRDANRAVSEDRMP